MTDRDAHAYNDTVLDHFRNPRNAGDLPDANAVGEDRNPVCGDHMRLMLRIDDGAIAQARFQTRGCAAAIATGPVRALAIPSFRITRRDGLVRALIG